MHEEAEAGAEGAEVFGECRVVEVVWEWESEATGCG